MVQIGMLLQRYGHFTDETKRRVEFVRFDVNVKNYRVRPKNGRKKGER